jgi:hypothetical protein
MLLCRLVRLRYASCRLIGALSAAFVLAAGPASPQFTPFAHGAATSLEGSWQSCREADGSFVVLEPLKKPSH